MRPQSILLLKDKLNLNHLMRSRTGLWPGRLFKLKLLQYGHRNDLNIWKLWDAASMQVARTTVQRIYEIARKKIADALIDGHPLRIEGGDFRICDGQSSNCSLGGCYKQEIYQKYAVKKGEGIMRIAVTYEDGQIFQHFGHTETFKIYDVEEGKVVHSEVVDTNGSGHGALAGVLNALNADVLICGGIGGGAQTALAAAGIKLFGGVSGDADKAVEAFINDTLDYNPDVKCSQHEHSRGEGHTCGEHGCGNHSCH